MNSHVVWLVVVAGSTYLFVKWGYPLLLALAGRWLSYLSGLGETLLGMLRDACAHIVMMYVYRRVRTSRLARRLPGPAWWLCERVGDVLILSACYHVLWLPARAMVDYIALTVMMLRDTVLWPVRGALLWILRATNAFELRAAAQAWLQVHAPAWLSTPLGMLWRIHRAVDSASGLAVVVGHAAAILALVFLDVARERRTGVTGTHRLVTAAAVVVVLSCVTYLLLYGIAVPVLRGIVA